MDVTDDDELAELAKSDEVINLLAHCGETSFLQVRFPLNIFYIVMPCMLPLKLCTLVLTASSCLLTRPLQSWDILFASLNVELAPQKLICCDRHATFIL